MVGIFRGPTVVVPYLVGVIGVRRKAGNGGFIDIVTGYCGGRAALGVEGLCFPGTLIRPADLSF